MGGFGGNQAVQSVPLPDGTWFSLRVLKWSVPRGAGRKPRTRGFKNIFAQPTKLRFPDGIAQQVRSTFDELGMLKEEMEQKG